MHHDNKSKIADAGGISRLVKLAGHKQISVRIEAIAALANLAVNGEQRSTSIEFQQSPMNHLFCFSDNNEVEIVRVGGLDPICEGCALAANGLSSGASSRQERELLHLEELATQCARALRNLSVNRKFGLHLFMCTLLTCFSATNKSQMSVLGVSRHLQLLANYPNERISQQARRALRNLEYSGK